MKSQRTSRVWVWMKFQRNSGNMKTQTVTEKFHGRNSRVLRELRRSFNFHIK